MNKIIFHEFDPVIYPLKLWVVKNPTNEVIKERFIHYDGEKIEDDFRKISAAAVYNTVLLNVETDNFGILVSIKNGLTVKYTAHEATHAARFMWDWLREREPAIEADAYLVGWIAECIWQVKTGKFK